MPTATVHRIPTSPDGLTAEWLSGALGVTITEAVVDTVIWGTATKVLMRLTYDGAAHGLPEHVCVKGGFDPRLDAFGIGHANQLEANFFADLAPSLNAGLPHCLFAGVDTDRANAAIVLDDLRATGCSFGDPLEPWTPDQAAAGLEVLARIHAETWAMEPRSWLTIGSGSLRATIPGMFTVEYFDEHFSRAEAPEIPEPQRDRERVFAGFQKMWTADDASLERCVAHCDPHVGNTFLRPDGTPGFLDWQCVALAPWSFDVAYFITGSLEIADRRNRERDLLAHYRTALAANGGAALDPDRAWMSYRRSSLHGYMWAITPPVMQTPERVAAMAARYTTAIDDLDVLRLYD